MKRITMIQANSLDKLVEVFAYICLHPGCTGQEVADFVGFTLRQADYYANACRYIGLLGDTLAPTPDGTDIMTTDRQHLREQVYARIVSHPLIGRIFARCYLLPESDISAYAKQLMIQEHPGYSEAVYDRRSDNLVKWCRRIIAYRDNLISTTPSKR